MRLEILVKELIIIFPNISYAENLNLTCKLSLNHGMKHLKQTEYLIFIFHQIKLSHTSTIINKSNKPTNII
jgi:hypothetical protein